MCNGSGNERQIKSKDVELALRMSFSKESFKKTELFNSLLEYEELNHLTLTL